METITAEFNMDQAYLVEKRKDWLRCVSKKRKYARWKIRGLVALGLIFLVASGQNDRPQNVGIILLGTGVLWACWHQWNQWRWLQQVKKQLPPDRPHQFRFESAGVHAKSDKGEGLEKWDAIREIIVGKTGLHMRVKADGNHSIYVPYAALSRTSAGPEIVKAFQSATEIR